MINKFFHNSLRPTLPYRERRAAAWYSVMAEVFQSTLPYRERLNRTKLRESVIEFQSTLLIRGVTAKSKQKSSDRLLFAYFLKPILPKN